MSFIEWRDIFNDVFEDYPNSWQIISASRNRNKCEHQMQRTGYARFHCPKCSNNWASAKAMVVFYYSNPSRWSGRVIMRFLGQQCRTCLKKTGNYVDPEFEETFIQLTLAKLHEQVGWTIYGKKRPPKQRHTNEHDKHDMKGPHEKNLCEACKIGICERT